MSMGHLSHYSWQSKRVSCPACHARRGFAPLAGVPGAGKCHACGQFFPPNPKANYGNENVLRTRGGPSIELNAGTKIDRTDAHEVPEDDVARTRTWLVRGSAEGIERAAIMENEGDLSLEESECEAAKCLGLTVTHSIGNMRKIIVEKTLLAYEHPFLVRIAELTGQPNILADWPVGVSDRAILFWYVDQHGRYRNAKAIHYDADGFHRLRSHENQPRFVYPGNPIPLYGEWQLTPSERRPFALFESEKTAIIASMHMPQYVCLAVGGHHLKEERKARVLQGRTGIILFDREPETIRAAEEAAHTLRMVGATACVESLESFYPGIPPNWDAADIIYHQFQAWQKKQLVQ